VVSSGLKWDNMVNCGVMPRLAKKTLENVSRNQQRKFGC
jgi:hypothetical protein